MIYYTRPSIISFEHTGPATAVCYDSDGRTYDIHHWADPANAELHAKLLNEGFSREAALQAVKDA